jgi:hypothetical protein
MLLALITYSNRGPYHNAISTLIKAIADSVTFWDQKPTRAYECLSLTYLDLADAQRPSSNGLDPDSADVGGDSAAVEVCL